MTFPSLSLRALLVASTALLAPSLAYSQEPADSEAETADAGLTLNEVVVLGRFIPEVLRSTSEVAAFLGPEDLARQGDSDAAAALARVTGLSIAQGKFVYVRGLGERYSAARLNGSPLPSPEPLQRVVPLDLFPTKILENVLVQKTYSVEYPGEFGGGIIDLRTLNVPNENFLTVSVGGSYNTETTGQSGLTHYGSQTDGLGFDNGARKLPAPVRRAMTTGQRIQSPTFTDEELVHMGQAFTNAPLRLLQRNDSIPADGSASISGGRKFDFGGFDLGVIAVLGYSNGWQTRNGRSEDGVLEGGVVAPESFYDYVQTDHKIGWDGLFGLGLDFGDDRIDWTNLYVRRTTKLTFAREGFDGLRAADVRDERTGWYERELMSTQLNGRHFRGPWTLDWRTALSQTKRDAPYEMNTRFGFNPLVGRYTYPGGNSDNSISFSYLDEKVYGGAVDVKYVQPLSALRDIEYSAGIEAQKSERSAQTRIFGFINNSGDPSLNFLVFQQRPDFLFANFNINPDQFMLREVTPSGGASAHNAELEVLGVYGKVDAEIMPLVRAAFGVRFEDATQRVVPLNIISSEGVPEAPPEKEEQYFLPAATLTWNFAEDQQLRLGASKSIGRPQFRELAEQQFFDPDSNRTFIGNPYLTDTEFLNLDARYERYFDRGQAFTLGVFYKQIDRPVEAVVTTQSASVFQTFLNAPKADLWGAEVEFKKVFETPFASAGSFFDTKDLFVQANYTYSDSKIRVSEGDQVFPLQARGQPRNATDFFIDGERLTGQSQHLANLQLGWQDETNRSQATLLINYASERTTGRAPGNLPDFIDEPGTGVDIVYKKGFTLGGRDFGFDFKAQNLLGNEFSETQSGFGGSIDVNRYDLGTTFSIGLSANF
ncbi:TonB-dependent receptor domain-containing protein [Hyphomonas sp.]|uniref:TonB-dependent receptor domain-containing protein n=1 Tax=Hyphomonas sp. TaxID=87 RepID=UPI00391B8D2D